MYCPFCSCENTSVSSTFEHAFRGNEVRRTRECSKCRRIFDTKETPIVQYPNVIDRNGNRHVFNEYLFNESIYAAEPENGSRVISMLLQYLSDLDDDVITSQSLAKLVVFYLKQYDTLGTVLRYASINLKLETQEDFLQFFEEERLFPTIKAP